MADPTTMQRRMPLGWRFCPTEEQLVAYFLFHKLTSHDPSIYNTIPEIDLCKHEPWELLALAASAFPGTEQDDSECYFFSPCDYKYPNSTLFNRTTPLGSWKVTGKDRQIKKHDTNKVIGIRKILVFSERSSSHGVQYKWILHEYHNHMLPPEQRNYVLYKLMRKYEKKIEEKTNNFEHESISDEIKSNNHTDFEDENPANFSILSKEYNLSNMNSTVQTSSYPEVMDSVIHTSFQPNDVTNLVTQTSLQSEEGYMSVQTSSYPEVMDSVIHTSFQPNDVTNLVTQTSLQSEEGYISNDVDSMIQIFYQSNGFLSPEVLQSIMDTPLGYDNELYHS